MAGNTTPGVTLRDSHLASKIFGFGKGSLTTAPKPKFLFFVKFFKKSSTTSALSGMVQTPTGVSITNVSTTSNSLEELGFVAKMVDKPKTTFQTETLNQYNKRRIVQLKHEFQPITMKFHDTADNRIFQLFQAYYQFYYGDAYNNQSLDWTNDVVAPGFIEIPSGISPGGSQNWGYSPPSYLNAQAAYFFDRIEIYQIFNGLYDKFTLVNPKITNFDPDEMNYEDGRGTSEISISFQYEGILLNVTNQSITPELAEMGLNLSDQFDINVNAIPTPTATPSAAATNNSTVTMPSAPSILNNQFGSAPSILSNQFGSAPSILGNQFGPGIRNLAALLGF